MKKQNDQEAALRAECVARAITRYTTHEDLDAFKKRNVEAIAQVVEKGWAVSGVMTGFSSQKDKSETYDAKMELQRMTNKEGEIYYRPKLHIKQKELIINSTISLPTNLPKERIAVDDVMLKENNNRFEANLNMGGEKIKVSLNEADILTLRTKGFLKEYIEGENNHVYSVGANFDKGNKGNISEIVVTQRQKMELSPKDINALEQEGRLNHTVAVGEGINQRQYFVCIDKDLNIPAFSPLSALNLGKDDKIYGVLLSQKNKEELLSGQKTIINNVGVRNGSGDGYTNVSMEIWFDPARKNIAAKRLDQQQPQAQQQQKTQRQKQENSPAFNMMQEHARQQQKPVGATKKVGQSMT